MSNYTTADIQKAYIAFFGRPGEPAGVDFWASVSGSMTLEQMYADFANQPEYRAYYADYINASTGAITDVVGMLNAVYNNLFNRDVEAGGLSFWSPLLVSGVVTIDDVVVEVLKGAQNDDKIAIDSKLEAATAFTAEAREQAYMGYAGAEAAEDAHDWLAGIYDEATKGDALDAAALETAVADCIAPDAPVVPTFDLAPSAGTVNEGNAVNFTLETTNVAAGSSYAYTISGVSASDVVGGSLSGTAVIGADGKAVISVGLVADAATEGPETLVLNVAGESASVTVNDSSVTPPVVPPAAQQFFTTGTDTLVGSGANEKFAGTVSSQTSRDTFQPGDTLDAGAGVDTLEIELDTHYNGNVAVTGIEKLFVEVTSVAGDLVFEAEEMFNQNSGLDEVWMENLSDRNIVNNEPQSGTLIIRDIATSDVTLGVKDSGSVVTGASNPSPDVSKGGFTPAPVWQSGEAPSAAAVFEFSEDQLLDSDDAIGLKLDNVRNLHVDINVGNFGEAIETVNVDSIASIPTRVNTLNGPFAADGNASTMTVNGAAGFTAELAGNFVNFDASAATGSQKIKFDASEADLDVKGGSAGDLFEMNGPGENGHEVDTNGGNDEVIMLNGGKAEVYLRDGNDSLWSNNTTDGDVVKVWAGAGDDKILLGKGNHEVYGEAGKDDITVGDGDSYIDAGTENDTASVGDGDSEVYMGAGDDTLTVRHADYLDGADIFNGGEGNNDTIIIGDLLDRVSNNGCVYDFGDIIDESDLYGISRFENLNLETDGVRIMLSDELINSSDSGTFTVNVDGRFNTIDLLTPSMGALADLTVNDRVRGGNTTVLVDRQYGNATLNLGTGYDTLVLMNAANLRAADLAKVSGLDEIFLTSGGPTEEGDFSIKLTDAFMDACDNDSLVINVDDDLPANSTLVLDLRDVDGANESLTVYFNGNLNSGDIQVLGDDSWVTYVKSLQMTDNLDRIIPGEGTTSNDDIVVASAPTDFQNADIVIGGDQWRNYTFEQGGDEFRIEFNVDLLDHSNGTAFIGVSRGTDESNTGLLSQIWGYDGAGDDGAATIDGFERITFKTNNDVSFVDDVTTEFDGDNDMGFDETYADDNSNMSDTGHVVFETGCGDDYIMTGDWNSTNTGAGEDVVELFENYVGGSGDDRTLGLCRRDNDVDADQADPNAGVEFVRPEPFRRHDTGTGKDRIILNSATTQVGIVTMNMGIDDADDVVELRSWDAILPDGGRSNTSAQVIVNAGSFVRDTGLEILEYAAKDCGENKHAEPCQNASGIEVGTTITLNDADIAAFEGNTAVVRPVNFGGDLILDDARDNEAALVFDSIAVTNGQVNVTGSHLADIIETGIGNDTVDGSSGNDYISTGAGNDSVNGGSDTIIKTGDTTQDTLVGGDDLIYTGDGDDTVDGGNGNDTIYGGNGDDSITAGTGRDCIHGGTGADTINLGNDGDVDRVLYKTAMEGALPGMNSGYDVITGFEVTRDRVVIADPLQSDIDGQGIHNISPHNTNNDSINWAPADSELVLRDATLGLIPLHEAVVYTHAGAGITDAQLVEDGFATVLAKINNTGVQARLGDQGIFVIQGETDTAIYLYNESMTDAGWVHASVEANELQLLGLFDNALLTKTDVEFGSDCCVIN